MTRKLFRALTEKERLVVEPHSRALRDAQAGFRAAVELIQPLVPGVTFDADTLAFYVDVPDEVQGSEQQEA